ncbi:MAG TPA: site-specific DNA-methyltransferase [Spirochaetota bacterium]|nr:site-specific DNA-methyltransferase [Spirochaetota bacterium]HQG41313.1 site-specific DNA-methyltransferase [Spirochaetota bacterium]HQK07353.1 site-specific DNA-methyltransferase [Spirochaetota bacterium]HRR59918.1 site-specific DNA-methyltransferase [Spirochaetota bacterium]
MPTLQFKGKNIIWNHHLSIPYHTLDEVDELHYKPEKANGNIIIEGDNLLALKALLPQYSGRIKCIYIDPPYNTGEENWVYNDNVNSPLIKEWLGKEVGTDCLVRHDKWLCMMVPRLKLLKELLTKDGIIFISLNDIENHYCKVICDEIFTKENFVANIIWEKRTARDARRAFSINHDHILVYANDYESFYNSRNLLPVTDEVLSRYSNPDNDPRGPWQSVAMTAQAGHATKDQFYTVITPTGKKHNPPKGLCWIFTEKKFKEEVKNNNIYFPKNGDGVPRQKKFLEERGDTGLVPLTIWTSKEVGTNDSAKKSLLEIFHDELHFDNPKPVELLRRIINISTSSSDIILDSFAGSGTTMHAVMDLNKEDGGNRQCILVQMTEATEAEPEKNICKDITRERIKRAIDKYGYDSGFKYFRVGIPIDAESLLSGKLPTFKQFAEYVYYLCTGEHIKDKSVINEKTYLVGSINNSVIYLVYKQNFDELTRLALNLPLAEKIIADNPRKKIIVYAPACFLEEDYMKENNIEFVGIPYNLFRRENGA